MLIYTKKGIRVHARLSSLSLRVILTALSGGELLDAEIPCVSEGEPMSIMASDIDVKRTFDGEGSTYSLVGIRKANDETSHE